MIRMIGVLCLGVACSGAFASLYEVSPEVEAAREALQTDPEIIDAYEQWQLAYEAWNESLTCHLLQRWQSPRVRLVTSGLLVWADKAGMPLVCPQRSGTVDADTIRQEALKDGWNDPAIVSQVFWTSCSVPTPPGWCDPDELYAQLLRLDSGNAAVILLPIIAGDSLNASSQLTDEDASALIASAASAAYFDLHWWTGSAAVWQAVTDFERRHPAPSPSHDLDAAFALAQTDFSQVTVLASLAITSQQVFRQYPQTLELIEACDAHADDETRSTREQCLQLAGLLDNAKTLLAQYHGNWLRRRLEAPESAETDPDQENAQRLRQRVERLATICDYPRVLHTFDARYRMPETHYEAYYRDLETVGERAASTLAARREYAVFPERFAMDPARCDAIRELDDETLQAVGELYLTPEHSDRDAALILLGELIEP